MVNHLFQEIFNLNRFIESHTPVITVTFILEVN